MGREDREGEEGRERKRGGVGDRWYEGERQKACKPTHADPHLLQSLWQVINPVQTGQEGE